jgi:hypothetical protein
VDSLIFSNRNHPGEQKRSPRFSLVVGIGH